MRAKEFIFETEEFNGLDISVEKNWHGDIIVRARAQGRVVGYVTFVQNGDKLLPQDLEVDERYHSRGIAATMYDYMKDQGYKVRRSHLQTDAGAGFWDKHRPGENVWEDWQKANKQDHTAGMSKKAVSTYRREHPGSKLQTAVTTAPGKLKKGSKSSKRRSSFCARSNGQKKMHNIDCSKTPDKPICKARSRWNCE
jgi:GNAT superfamily N-acetyltransferase